MMPRSVLVLLAVLACSLPGARAADGKKVDYQKQANQATWQWEPGRASVFHSFLAYQGDYQVEILRQKEQFGLLVRFTDRGKHLYALEAHAGTVFAQRDHVLYLADFNPHSSGCTLVAYDFEAKRHLWKTPLQGLGPIDHTKYHNAVTLEVGDDVLTVYGQESAGKYVEYVDRKTGKTVGHKVFADRK
jgi:hypothetical protein